MNKAQALKAIRNCTEGCFVIVKGEIYIEVNKAQAKRAIDEIIRLGYVSDNGNLEDSWKDSMVFVNNSGQFCIG